MSIKIKKALLFMAVIGMPLALISRTITKEDISVSQDGRWTTYTVRLPYNM